MGPTRPESLPLRTTLVRPPILQLAGNLSSYGAILPIGLAYVAAALRDAGHEITVIDAPGEALDRFLPIESPVGEVRLNGLKPEEIVARLDSRTQVLGVTHMFLHEWPMIREIVERAKAKVPDLVVVLGGENATAFWPWIFQETPAVDYCVLGEGESTMVELLARLAAGAAVDDLPGIASRSGEHGRASGLSPRMTKLEGALRPAWDLFPVDHYMRTADNHGVHRGRSIPILATRGCPYQCTFCSSPQMWTTTYATRPARDVVEEMKFYVERYGVNNMNFCDLTAFIRKEWLVEFCTLLAQENLGITWQLPTGTRTEALDAEALQLLYDTGCRNITYAPESGSLRMLEILKKKVKISRMLDSFRAAHRAGIITRTNIIIGHPQETRRDLWKSFQFLMRVAWTGCQDAAIMIFAPYPGSADFEYLRERGEVNISNDYYYLALARSGLSSKTYNPRMTTWELILVQYSMLLAFYSIAYLSRPWRIVNLIYSQFTGAEQTQLDQFIRSKRRQLIQSNKWLAHMLRPQSS